MIALAVTAGLTVQPARAQTQVFADEFNSGSINPGAWQIYEPAYFLQRTQWGLAPTFGADADGTQYARIPIQSYNPNTAYTGKDFLGSEIFSRDTWQLGNGLEYEARIRSNNLPPGLVLGFFSYGDSGEWTSTYQKTEIDYEFLTTQGTNKTWLNIWDAWNPERGGPNSATLTSTPSWNNNTWNTFLIRWLPGKTEWIINGQVVRTETTVLPGSPQGVCLNLWAADSNWGTAYSSAIAPTSDPEQNKTWSFDVDYVRVRRLNAAPPPTNGLNVTYYDNASFSGTSVSRIDPNINFDWGSSSPDSRIGPDTFSARWTGSILAPTTGTYTFTARTDDGVRLWVNDKKLLDNWRDQSPTEKSGSISLTGGRKYSIKMEYYDNTGGAVAQLSWSGPGIPKQIIPSANLFFTGSAPPANYGDGTGLTGTYFDNSNFTGTQAVRLDPRINFDWGQYAPVRGFGTDTFSARWTGYIQPLYSETYTFGAKTDDGVRVTINGTTVVNSLTSTGLAERSGSIALTAGTKYPITVEYVEQTGNASAQLFWSSASTPKQLVPQSQLYPENVPAAPTFSIPPGNFTTNQPVVIQSATNGASIRYTLDGSDPTENSAVLANGGTLTIKSPTVLRARTFIPGWVLSPITSGYYNVVDSISPTVTITSPKNNPIANTLPIFAGTAADSGSGINRVNIVLTRTSDGLRWNGTTWVDTEYGLRCTLSGTLWSFSTPLPTGTNLKDGTYTVKAVAFDNAGNTAATQPETFRLERVSPAVQITSPTSGATLATLNLVSGTCSDNWSGINKVGLVITRLGDAMRWNGTAWITTDSNIPATVSGSTFTVNSKFPSGANLPDGQYELKVVAYDKAGNVRTDKITITVSAGATSQKSQKSS